MNSFQEENAAGETPTPPAETITAEGTMNSGSTKTTESEGPVETITPGTIISESAKKTESKKPVDIVFPRTKDELCEALENPLVKKIKLDLLMNKSIDGTIHMNNINDKLITGRINISGEFIIKNCSNISFRSFDCRSVIFQIENCDNILFDECDFGGNSLQGHGIFAKNAARLTIYNSYIWGTKKALFKLENCEEVTFTRNVITSCLIDNPTGNEVLIDNIIPPGQNDTMIIADFDNCGYPEKVVYNIYGILTIYSGEGFQKISAQKAISSDNIIPDIIAWDVNADGFLDIVPRNSKYFCSFIGSLLSRHDMPAEKTAYEDSKIYQEDIDNDGVKETISVLYSLDLQKRERDGKCTITILNEKQNQEYRLELSEKYYINHIWLPELSFYDTNHDGTKDILLDNGTIYLLDSMGKTLVPYNELSGNIAIENPEVEVSDNRLIIKLYENKQLLADLTYELPGALEQENLHYGINFSGFNIIEEPGKEILCAKYILFINKQYLQEFDVRYSWDHISEKWIYSDLVIGKTYFDSSNAEETKGYSVASLFDPIKYVYHNEKSFVYGQICNYREIEFQEYIFVTTDSISLKNGIKVGQSKEEVLPSIKTIRSGSESTWNYTENVWNFDFISGPKEGYINLYFKEDVLKGIEFFERWWAPWD